MKKLTTLLFCLIISLGINAQENKETKGVIFSHGTLAESLAKAKSNKKGPKLVFLDCYTSWCGPCKYMANTIFPMEVSGNFFNKNFVNIKIDMEKGEGVDVAKKYGIKAYPTFLILDAEGKEINRLVGSSETAEDFIAKVKVAMDANNSPQAKKAAYNANKNMENAVACLEAFYSSYMEKEMSEFMEEVFPTLSSEDRYSDKMWPYLSQIIRDPQSKIFAMVLDEKSVADKFLSKEKADGIICSGLKSYAYGYIGGRMQNADKEDVLNKVKMLNLLSFKDETAPYIVNIVKLYSDNKVDEIAKLLDVQKLTKLSADDKRMVENFIFAVKGLPQEKKTEYLKALVEYHKNQAKQLEEYCQKISGK